MLPSDCTFNHRRGLELYDKEQEKGSVNFYSIDLSAATDRMPRILQAQVISAI